eukprot:6182141-Pleurochrysis_carterae.AAC.1
MDLFGERKRHRRRSHTQSLFPRQVQDVENGNGSQEQDTALRAWVDLQTATAVVDTFSSSTGAFQNKYDARVGVQRVQRFCPPPGSAHNPEKTSSRCCGNSRKSDFCFGESRRDDFEGLRTAYRASVSRACCMKVCALRRPVEENGELQHASYFFLQELRRDTPCAQGKAHAYHETLRHASRADPQTVGVEHGRPALTIVYSSQQTRRVKAATKRAIRVSRRKSGVNEALQRVLCLIF